MELFQLVSQAQIIKELMTDPRRERNHNRHKETTRTKKSLRFGRDYSLTILA